MRVLVIEDDLGIRQTVQEVLEHAGHDVRVAPDGTHGLTAIDRGAYDVVLLDLMLPFMSGDEILREMRKSDWGKDIKAIFLTNISEAEAPDGIEELQFERYIVKANIMNDQLTQIIAETIQAPA